jgi:adenylate kinase
MKRLTGRRTCTKCGEIYNVFLRPPQREGFCDLDGAPLSHRSDDKPETVSTRLEAYEQSTKPLIDYYRQSRRLIEIDGERPVDEVFHDLRAVLNAAGAH